MGRFQKTLKKYERHFLLTLVILLLLTFSVGGAMTCDRQQAQGEVDYGGEFLVTPTKRKTLESNDYVGWLRRLDPYRQSVRSPTLRYQIFHQAYQRRAAPLDRMRATWTHAMLTEAARAAGYEVGEEWQLKDAVRSAVSSVMQGLPFNDATYDRFLREYYRRSPKDFEDTVREIVLADQFVQPLIETPRLQVSYEEAYEVWKNLLERVDLGYVALSGADFNLAALQRETTRDRIGDQVTLLDDVSRAGRDLDLLDTRVRTWRDGHDGELPGALDELTDVRRDDPWGEPFRYAKTDDGYDLRSAGPDGAFDSSDDVTPRTVAQLKTRAALREVGAALLRWHEATEAWPETIEAMREAPTEGALAPLTGSGMDAWDRPLVYDPSSGEAPTLVSAGADGVTGNDDDVAAVVTAAHVHVPPGRAFVPWLVEQDRDAWDRPMRIDLANALTWSWSVTSAGPDGELGTDDDLDTSNHRELQAFYDRPEVKVEFEVPEQKEFEALYVHLPLIPDAALAWLLETYPQHRPDEEEAFNRWRQLHEYSYYMAEDPRDPESGHGAELARRVAPDHTAALVPASTVFGEPPEGFAGEDDPDRATYVEKGWRPILLREMFLENVLNDLLTRARDTHKALAAWEERKKAFDEGEGEGEEPGEKPEAVTFQDLLQEELADFRPKEGDAPWLRLWRTEAPMERADIENLPDLGDINLTLGLQQLKNDGDYGATPTIVNDSHTKVLLHLVKDLPRRERPFEEVRDEIFDRFVESNRLDLAAEALEDLREAVAEAVRVERSETGEEPDLDAAWTRAVDAWKAGMDVPVHVGSTGPFIGAKPPSAEPIDDDMDEAMATRIQRRDFVRATGYDALRAGLKPEEGLTGGDLAKNVLRDDLTEGSDSVFLVRLGEVAVPPRAAFSPRAYADYLSVEVLGGPKGGRGLGAPSGAGLVTGSLWEGIGHFYFDYTWVKGKLDLQTGADPDLRPQQ